MDDIINIVQVSESEIKNIQLDKNLGKKVKLALALSYQNNYKAKDFDIDVNTDKAKANNNKLI